MSDYNDILNALNVSLAVSETSIECKGVYIPGAHTILVSPELSDAERQAVIVHELGHLINEHEYNEWNAPAIRLKQERQANEHLADELVKEYLDSFITMPESISIDDFIDNRGISMDLYDCIKQAFERAIA
ncbi:ImmA/IrrE family metallo-endopeptidase [Weissella ceti]|uniref:ImmA/IrrE family metallo-endopeptidase n=1 Tax=Weissella ceti TaxID=759620 RepID=A0ABT3E3P9_9LACO|nr:ImmA/IrrE family metallo-endopeptidase [Weissella ceti]MCW0953040.1 ImmA/IrrE family metallo-endopeptidase [Weissella ceti]QVK11585.1 ImmA/IrrE family metallo-endopeptidase [Weissella ceti]